jgi:hypothetical protein
MPASAIPTKKRVTSTHFRSSIPYGSTPTAVNSAVEASRTGRRPSLSIRFPMKGENRARHSDGRVRIIGTSHCACGAPPKCANSWGKLGTRDTIAIVGKAAAQISARPCETPGLRFMAAPAWL